MAVQKAAQKPAALDDRGFLRRAVEGIDRQHVVVRVHIVGGHEPDELVGHGPEGVNAPPLDERVAARARATWIEVDAIPPAAIVLRADLDGRGGVERPASVEPEAHVVAEGADAGIRKLVLHVDLDAPHLARSHEVDAEVATVERVAPIRA